ncbi:MAG: acyltransferase [Porphyrobacter sp. IPPAS B-1204]|nr:MAG: acyltransferase [Porphyrobacter sp. IPPAS B-1204]
MGDEGAFIFADQSLAPDGKIAAIQLLRALAAFIVAAAHIAFGFADHVGAGLGLGGGWQAGREGQVAVLLFFIVSGYVMVTASRDSFGKPGGRGRFWLRRFIRIMPPYWLASALLAGVLTVLYAQEIDAASFIASLVLVPSWPPSGELRPLVFLWVGWTLIFEMGFYFIFGLFLPLPRAQAVLSVVGVLAVMIIAGTWVPPVNPLLFMLTRPVLAMFVAGMGLALWRSGGAQAHPGLRWVALLGIVPAMLFIPDPAVPSAMGWDYLAWAGMPTLLVAFAVLGGPLALPASGLINAREISAMRSICCMFRWHGSGCCSGGACPCSIRGRGITSSAPCWRRS